VGFFNPVTNIANYSVYSVYPMAVVNNVIQEAFSFSVVRSYLDILHGSKTSPIKTTANDSYYSLYPEDSVFVPYAAKQVASGEQKKEALINYIPERKKFPYLSFVDVYNDAYDGTKIKDAIVILGSTATALHDEFPTPVGILPGVYVHANMVNTILTKRYIQYLTTYREIIILICFIFLITLIGVYTKNKFYIITSALLLSFGFFYTYRLMFFYGQKIFSYPLIFLVGILASFTLINVYRYIYEDRGKRLLKNTLSQYLAEDLVVSILSNYEEVRLGGMRREITTFFSDIEGFTSFSENMDPEELVHFLSIYLKDASDIIMHQRGFINKYE
jgi:adenylate cyclase